MKDLIEIVLLSALLSEGKKVARLKGNRELDSKIVRKKKESMKQFGLLSPAIIIDGSKAVEEGLEIINFETGEDISNEDADQYIVFVEGNHRYKSHLELLEANEKLEKGQKYNKEFYVMYPLNEDMPVMKMLAEINVCTDKWKTRDIVKGAAVINGTDSPRLLIEVNKLMEQGYSLNAASLWLTFTKAVDKKVMDAAMKGSFLEQLKNETGLKRGLQILEVAKEVFGEKLCKTRTTLSGWVVSKYMSTAPELIPAFTDNMIQFMRSIDSDAVKRLQKVKGKIGEGSKEDLINRVLNEFWDSFESQASLEVESEEVKQ